MRRNKGSNLENYVPVHERLDEFHNKYPEGYITTFEISSNKDGEVTGYKAVVFRNKQDVELYGSTSIAAASGHSGVYDTEADKSFEKAETVAIGRALANLGLSVEKGIASEEEMEEHEERTSKKSRRKSRFKKAAKVEDEENTEDEETDEEDSEESDDDEEETKLTSSRRFSGSRFKRGSKKSTTGRRKSRG